MWTKSNSEISIATQAVLKMQLTLAGENFSREA